jgi:hypothetical protein
MLGHKADEAARRWDRREVDQSMDVEIEQIFKRGKLASISAEMCDKSPELGREDGLRKPMGNQWETNGIPSLAKPEYWR